MVASLALSPRGGAGAAVRTNLFPNPAAVGTAGFSFFAGSGGAATLSAGSTAGVTPVESWVRLTWTVASSGVGGLVVDVPVVAGVSYAASCYVRASGSKQMRAVIEWKNSGGGTITTTVGASVLVGAANVRLSAIGVAPALAVTARVTFYRASDPWLVGEGLTLTAVLVEADTALDAYFDGNTPEDASAYSWTGAPHASTSVAKALDPDTNSAAIFALGYEVTRAVRTIVHQVLDAAVLPVTFKPAGPRSGRIEYLFSEWETCRRAEIIHTRPGYVTLTDADWPGSPMRYVPQGDVVVRLDPETRARWILDTGFLEVTA